MRAKAACGGSSKEQSTELPTNQGCLWSWGMQGENGADTGRGTAVLSWLQTHSLFFPTSRTLHNSPCTAVPQQPAPLRAASVASLLGATKVHLTILSKFFCVSHLKEGSAPKQIMRYHINNTGWAALSTKVQTVPVSTASSTSTWQSRKALP